MNQIIADFISKNDVMTVACVDAESHPYCFNSFYLFMRDENVLLFSSAPDGTRHIEMMYNDTAVAGTILPTHLDLALIKGLQFTGFLVDEIHLDNELIEAYRLKYPQANSMPHAVWGIKLTFAKLTDNSVHFGYKVQWNE